MEVIDGIGISFALIGEEHLLTSFLSSPGTVRNLFVAQGKDVDGIRTDLNVALALGIGFSFLIAYFLKSKITAWAGVGFGVVLYEIYKIRAGL